MMRNYVPVLILLLGLMTAPLGCRERPAQGAADKVEDVEISPGVFITMERWIDIYGAGGPESTRLRVPYQEDNVEWDGVGKPVILREHGGRLYMVIYDRETPRRSGRRGVQYLYFRQGGNKFVRIDAAQFPKEVAIQNVLVDTDDVRALLELDTADSSFQVGLTADIWEELETGKREHEPVSFVSKAFLDQYVQRYKPSRLTEIKRTRVERPAPAPG
jgi:hypothetical protein